MRALVLAALLLPAASQAQAIVSAVLEAQGVSDAQVKRAQRATEAALKQVSGLPVAEGPAFKKGAPRKCTGDCARELVAGLSTPNAVLLDLKAAEKGGDKVMVELSLWLDGEKVGSRRGEGTIDGFETAARPALEALMPPWARKGFGGLRLEVEAGAVVKVDGRVSQAKAGEVVAVPAGPHQVDVVFPEGHAVLQRVEVTEGTRARLGVTSPSEVVQGGAAPKSGALRAASYALWMAGAASIAGGLIAGALARGTGAGLSSCQGDVRDCAPLDEVQQKQAQAQAYATTGNVLLGVGAGLAAVGAGLFVVDVVTP
ncbi:MAG: hypothetical protein AMXMBFR34_03180 [Myxococcaceae bacterium]